MVIEKNDCSDILEALKLSLLLLSEKGTSRDTQLAEFGQEATKEQENMGVGRSEKKLSLGPKSPHGRLRYTRADGGSVNLPLNRLWGSAQTIDRDERNTGYRR